MDTTRSLARIFLTEKHERSILCRVEIDHLTVPVSDYESAKRFYVRALQPLGYGVLMDWPDARRVFLGSLRRSMADCRMMRTSSSSTI